MSRRPFKKLADSMPAIPLRSTFPFVDCSRASVLRTVTSPTAYQRRARWRLILVALTIGIPSAYGQSSLEVTPLVGGRFGGSLKLQQEGLANRLATLDNALSFGVAAGFRFDGEDCESCDLVELRWMRQNTHLGFKDNSANIPLFRSAVNLDYFLADFTHEFPVKETQNRVRPFVTASLGAVRMSTPTESRPRFVFGIGGGVNVFPKPRWGLRIQGEYLPIARQAEVQKVVCAGGCVVVLNGGVMNQFVLNVGPIFRLK